ncbi:hypothetical protein MYSTI_00264 [Myxococcus stipitatus DSM 14675]|uniref:Uncharacterized protein n=1 Tax=Myxococcus stipitatus (strain DSM 14675 / JCM 12634 / Mx s8) TaxID=1278073 RepID=L7U051_MYXSD|nr:hypothetical protein [Myxococcus stipitatus]AGC41623.1 hypothetical protein MYSTI_00264 [Myxococcus stipitatus DSM 14675]
MESEQFRRSWPFTGVVLWMCLALPASAVAQDEGARLSALELLIRSPQLGGSDIPRDLPGPPGGVEVPLRADASTSSGAAMAGAQAVSATTLPDAPVRPSSGDASTPGLSEEMSPGGPEGSSALLSEAPRTGVSDGAPLTLLPESSPSRSFQVLPAVVAVVPGLLFHGLAPAIAGDGQTARRLFAMEGAGLGLIALGGVPIALTGASRRTIAPLYAVTLAGFSVFGISALANLYSVVSPTFDPGVPAATLPPLELEMGYQYVSDTSFDYDHFVSLGAVARLDSLKLEAVARLAPEDGNAQVRFGGAYRLLGAPEQRRGDTDGSSLDAELFGLYHRYPTEGFIVIGGDLGLRGRFAMSRVSPALAGSFAEASIGMSLQGYSYPGPVSDGNLHEQLLYSFGYGVWLGRGGPFKGEAMIFYDHRKDGFAGGLRTFGGGVVGNFGLRGRALLTETWGVAAEVAAGGALVGRLSLIYALGGES